MEAASALRAYAERSLNCSGVLLPSAATEVSTEPDNRYASTAWPYLLIDDCFLC